MPKKRSIGPGPRVRNFKDGLTNVPIVIMIQAKVSPERIAFSAMNKT